MLRSGASTPDNEACATTAKISPDNSARRLPLADNTSNRLAQPRAMTMPAPNNKPPSMAPERLPRVASWRAVLTSSAWVNSSTCTATTALANASSQTDSFSPKRRCQNSITAARRQKRERCAK